MKKNQADAIEYQKRIRQVQDWILDDHPSCDILRKAVAKYKVVERQAARYLAEARKRWVEEEQMSISQRRRTKIQSLKRQKRLMKKEYQGTPEGMRTILLIDKEISKLENLYPINQINHKVDVKPVQVEVDQVATVLILPSNGRELAKGN